MDASPADDYHDLLLTCGYRHPLTEYDYLCSYDGTEWEDWEVKCYAADFETTTDPHDCRVWAAAVCSVDDTDSIWYGDSVEWFVKWCELHAGCRVYFHNLAFDGAFIMDWLERNGWLWVTDSSNRSDMTYTTLINDVNQVYSITLYFTPVFKVTIYDSLKIIPLSISDMARAYKLPILKGELDYEEYREVGHVLTEEEKAYIRNDVQIAAMVLKSFLDEHMTRMTAGSNALYTYKSMMGGSKNFRKMFPVLSEEEDSFIRKAYRGGFTYAAERFKGRLLGKGLVYDVNSLYPSVMAAMEGQLLPRGKPRWFDGEPDHDEFRPLWVACLTCSFKLREGYIPTIQLKGNYRFRQTEYLKDSEGMVTLTISSVDWVVMCEHYVVSDITWHGGYDFCASDSMFKDYVDHWTEVKIKAGKEGNAGKRQIAKLMLNSLYGKFATRTEVMSRKPLIENDVLRYVDLPPETRDPVYLPVGVFITAWARKKTIDAAQAHYDRFAYCDTDSIHLIGDEEPEDLDVDDFRLGAWKLESTFDRAKFIGAKCYVEEKDDELNIHVAGMPKSCHGGVTLENFAVGSVYDGKLYMRRVKGGIVLERGTMEIKERL